MEEKRYYGDSLGEKGYVRSSNVSMELGDKSGWKIGWETRFVPAGKVSMVSNKTMNRFSTFVAKLLNM